MLAKKNHGFTLALLLTLLGCFVATSTARLIPSAFKHKASQLASRNVPTDDDSSDEKGGSSEEGAKGFEDGDCVDLSKSIALTTRSIISYLAHQHFHPHLPPFSAPLLEPPAC